MNMTVQDVLNLPQLYPMQLKAGLNNVHRPVRWFYIAENEGIAEWIEGGEIVFITGINYLRDESNLLDLVVQAVDRQVAALVIMTGEHYIQQIPTSVIQRANEFNLPLIEQPYCLKMVEVTHVIGKSLIQFSQLKKSAEDIVAQLLAGDFPSLEIMQIRAKQLNLDFLGRHLIAVLKFQDLHELFYVDTKHAGESQLFKIKQSCYEHLEQWLLSLQQKFPLLRQGEQFTLILSLEQRSIGEWLSDLKIVLKQLESLSKGIRIFAGLSNEVNSMVAFQRGFWEANQAREIACDMQMSTGICTYQDLGVVKLLKAIPNKMLLQDFMHDTLGMLILSDKKNPYVLLETLDAWINTNGNLVEAAKRLDIHRNTLNQRIQKIETLVGQELTQANFRLNAAIALLIWHMSRR